MVTAYDCPRISPAFLAEEQRSLGDRWFKQGYLCSFEDTIDQVFSYDTIVGALRADVVPLFAPVMETPAAISGDVRPLFRE